MVARERTGRAESGLQPSPPSGPTSPLCRRRSSVPSVPSVVSASTADRPELSQNRLSPGTHHRANFFKKVIDQSPGIGLDALRMKSLAASLALFLAAATVHAGGFGGPPPFTNGSPLPDGVDGSYQASATAPNTTGIIRFKYMNGVQTTNVKENS